MQRKAGLVFMFLVAVVLAVPPTVYADGCTTYANRYIGYFADCACQACAGWALTNCTECWTSDGRSCRTTSSGGYCAPRNQDPW